MRSTRSKIEPRTQLVLLVIGILILFLLTLVPHGRLPITSTEADIAEKSIHGLNIIPASCASYGADHYDAALPATSDSKGYQLGNTGTLDYGNYSASANTYVCAENASTNTYYIPALTANEIKQFTLHPPPGVTAWCTNGTTLTPC